VEPSGFFIIKDDGGCTEPLLPLARRAGQNGVKLGAVLERLMTLCVEVVSDALDRNQQ